MLNGHNPGSPKTKWTPFRENLIQVLQDAEEISDQDLKAKLAKLLEDKIEHYEVRRPTIVLKQVH